MTATLAKEIEQIAQQTAMKFPSEVVRIRHYIGHDWTGDPSIHNCIPLDIAKVCALEIPRRG